MAEDHQLVSFIVEHRFEYGSLENQSKFATTALTQLPNNLKFQIKQTTDYSLGFYKTPNGPFHSTAEVWQQLVKS